MKKNKILIFILLVIFLISVFSVCCFAAGSFTLEAGQTYVFNDVFVFGSFVPYKVEFDFTVPSGRSFSSMSFLTSGGSNVLYYDDQPVFASGNGWFYSDYRYFTVLSDTTVDDRYGFATFFENNLSVVPDSEPLGFLDVLTSVSDWVSSTLSSTDSLFFVDGHFTLFGGLLVLGLSVGLVLLLVYLLFNFVRLL